MKENYSFPVILSNDDNGTVIARILNFNQTVYADTESEVIHKIQDAIALCIIDMEKSGNCVPDHLEINDIMLECNEKLIYVHLWMPYFRTAVKEVYVKKTLTMPQSLDMLAKESNINFSAALVKGIKLELGMDV